MTTQDYINQGQQFTNDKTSAGYWNERGVYQAEYDRLYKELVPQQGEADTHHGELLRSISRLYWDFFNNGGGNCYDYPTEIEEETCCVCGGSGVYYEDDEEIECENCYGIGFTTEEVEGDKYWVGVFKHCYEYLNDHLPETNDVIAYLSDIENAIFNGWKKCWAFDKIMDIVIYTILTTENEPMRN